jgi:hypothetical protein
MKVSDIARFTLYAALLGTILTLTFGCERVPQPTNSPSPPVQASPQKRENAKQGATEKYIAKKVKEKIDSLDCVSSKGLTSEEKAASDKICTN